LLRNSRAYAYTALVLILGLLALPSLSAAASGGSSVTGGGGASGSGGSSGSGSGSGTGTTSSPTGPVSASGNGITLHTRANAMLRKGLVFSGTAPQGSAGRTIQIQRLGHQTDWRWTNTVKVKVRSNGTFRVVWHTNHIGRFSVRAAVVRSGAAIAATDAPTVTVTVYRQAIATLYGPGFWGRRTACGVKLTRKTVGVANRTLKCGTKVAIYYRGRTMVVPVIDRGPYANHADWDLTMVTGKDVGMTQTEHIGAVSLPGKS
jgi:rare lipoprotein A